MAGTGARRYSREVPRYDQLPIFPGSNIRHSWDVFGWGDELGTLNLLTP
jgi:hypothetical protein